ncbi:MAG: hypothetical protein KIT84_40225 [Labilithrix sp.]|nr:hypothetical protein [Labilithrix sp.]MCW5817294.1 hypothetical protein [Labilithrix sp.]
MVIGLAVGSSLTPFVPVPFVDDWILERLLRRIARKVMDKGGMSFDAKPIVRSYLETGDPSFGVKAATTVARFVVRKVAVVLDVMKSHDVFGEAIAFALALDSAVRAKALDATNGPAVGAAIHRSIQAVGSGLVDAITRAGKASFKSGKPHQRIAEEIGAQIDDAWLHLDRAMHMELR